MKTLLTILICLLIASCNNKDLEYPEIKFLTHAEVDSIWDVHEQSVINGRCDNILPSDVKYMVNGLGQITLKKGRKFIDREYDGAVWALKDGYEWGTYPEWFKDSCSAKSAYFDLLEFQAKKRQLQRQNDSISHLRNQIKPLNK